MSEEITNTTTSDERLIGAVAHFFGMLAALIIWVMQKDKSKYVRFQAAQALAFDIVALVFGGILSFCLVGVIFLGVAGSAFAIVNSSSPDDLAPIFMIPMIFPIGIFTCVLPFSLILLVLRTFAAGSVLAGRDFRYPVLGNLVENFLGEHS